MSIFDVRERQLRYDATRQVQPVEIVRTRKKAPEAISFAVGTWSELFTVAWMLMLAAPFFHEVVGSPKVHPGYWACFIVALALRNLPVAFSKMAREVKDVLGLKR